MYNSILPIWTVLFCNLSEFPLCAIDLVTVRETCNTNIAQCIQMWSILTIFTLYTFWWNQHARSLSPINNSFNVINILGWLRYKINIWASGLPGIKKIVWITEATPIHTLFLLEYTLVDVPLDWKTSKGWKEGLKMNENTMQKHK